MTVPFHANKLSKDYSPLMYNPFEYSLVSVYVHNTDKGRQFICPSLEEYGLGVCVKITNQHDNEFNLRQATEKTIFEGECRSP